MEDDVRIKSMDEGEGTSIHHHLSGFDHIHSHSHDHDHAQDEVSSEGRTVRLEQQLLARNNLLAERNRGWFLGRNILALNLVSSPGAGKTTLLERTIRDLKDKLTISVIEGDQETTNDAERIRATGCHVVQINTGKACHLDAHMISHALQQLQPPMNSVVMIENVGNLICPSLFDLGEKAKVLIVSVTEGEDKPLKYPHIFQASELVILNKTDLLPFVEFEVDKFLSYTHKVNPRAQTLQLSAKTGDGLMGWYEWVLSGMGESTSVTA